MLPQVRKIMSELMIAFWLLSQKNVNRLEILFHRSHRVLGESTQKHACMGHSRVKGCGVEVGA